MSFSTEYFEIIVDYCKVFSVQRKHEHQTF